jgi:hypothetical protein
MVKANASTASQLNRASTDEYCSFISNPQADGVWSIRIELSETQIDSLASFLHIDSYRLSSGWRHYNRLSGRSRYETYEDRPPILLPRLFAYLRAAMTQEERTGLPDLSPQEDSRVYARGRFTQQRRYRFMNETLNPPSRIGPAKRKRLRKAVNIYRHHFAYCRIIPVPEDPTKIDCSSPSPRTYFQVSDEPPAFRVSSPCEITLERIRDILATIIPGPLASELTKVYSPENTLMGMYLPMLRLIPLSTILKNKTAAANVRQALDEAREERFVHAIRAIGIAAEELLVEIYETYLREKAPEAPLGNIIHELISRIQEVVHGVKASKEGSLSTAREQIGKAIEAEKESANNRSFLLLATQLQKSIIPILETLKQFVDDSPALSLRAQKINLFPPNVQRCLSELVILRNRVSHRVERVVSVASVGYIDTAIALRDFIVIAKWWESERSQINYRTTRKAMIQETVKRSRSQGQESDGSAQ